MKGIPMCLKRCSSALCLQGDRRRSFTGLYSQVSVETMESGNGQGHMLAFNNQEPQSQTSYKSSLSQRTMKRVDSNDISRIKRDEQMSQVYTVL